MQTDRYGLPLSTSQPRARDAYLAAVDSLLGAMPGDLEGFEAALRHDPPHTATQRTPDLTPRTAHRTH